eukprot:1076714-Amphidinium_carterae.1
MSSKCTNGFSQTTNGTIPSQSCVTITSQSLDMQQVTSIGIDLQSRKATEFTLQQQGRVDNKPRILLGRWMLPLRPICASKWGTSSDSNYTMQAKTSPNKHHETF